MRFRETGGRDRVFKRKEKYAFIKNRAFHPILRRVLSLRYVLKIAGTSRRTKKKKERKRKAWLNAAKVENHRQSSLWDQTPM